jgi:syntaxin-binding protein 5
LVFIGTTAGRVATLKILPEAGGRFGASFAGITALEDKIISIAPINAENGKPAIASQHAVAGLRTGLRVNGVLLVTMQSGARIFKPASAKGAHRSWDGILAYSSTVCAFEGRHALVAVFSDNCARAYTLPGLKEVGLANLSRILDARKLSESMILPSGAIFGWTGPSEMAQLNCWGVGRDL